MMRDPDAAADLIDDAADHLETYGWLQGALGQPCRPSCASGALTWASDNDDHYHHLATAHDALADRIQADLGDENFYGLSRWNDSVGRTRQQVLDTFRAAAKDLRS
jgi:hypothetical protein